MKMIDLSEYGHTRFERLKEEELNEYKLKDGSVIKVKPVLSWIKLQQKGEHIATEIQIKYEKITDPAPELCGKPDSRSYTEEELSEFIIDEDIDFKSVRESWNEYLLEDGSKLSMRISLKKVSRTNKFNDCGKPIYLLKYYIPQCQIIF